MELVLRSAGSSVAADLEWVFLSVVVVESIAAEAVLAAVKALLCLSMGVKICSLCDFSSISWFL